MTNEMVPRASAENIANSLSYLLETLCYIPASNCSCHINTPCNDCVNFASIREAIKEAETLLKEYEAQK